MFNINFAVNCKLNIFYHLPCIHFRNQYSFYLIGIRTYLLVWERKKGYRPQQSNLYAFFASQFYRFFRYPCCRTKCNDQIFGIVTHECFITHLFLLHLLVLGLKPAINILLINSLDV